MNALRVSWLYLKIGVINELQYRVNFFVQVLQSLIQVGTALVMLALGVLVGIDAGLPFDPERLRATVLALLVRDSNAGRRS